VYLFNIYLINYRYISLWCSLGPRFRSSSLYQWKTISYQVITT